LFILAAFWPAAYGISFIRNHGALSALWFLSCGAMSTFTLLPAMKTENVNLMFVLSFSLSSFPRLTEAEQHDWWWADDRDRAAILDV